MAENNIDWVKDAIVDNGESSVCRSNFHTYGGPCAKNDWGDQERSREVVTYLSKLIRRNVHCVRGWKVEIYWGNIDLFSAAVKAACEREGLNHEDYEYSLRCYRHEYEIKIRRKAIIVQ